MSYSVRKALFVCQKIILQRSLRITSAVHYSNDNNPKRIDLSVFPPERIRNFGIVAHVDHGKSTVADRLLEVTGSIPKSQDNKQVLDNLPVERERGITVKAQTASLIYNYENEDYLLNLIDTPGHVDFSYEVSRSLAACQGVVLIVDATQGIQAQTLANFYLTMEHDLQIIPVINKIDLKTANVEKVKEEMKRLLDINTDYVLPVSAKHGTNIDKLLKAIVEQLPAPNSNNPNLCNLNNDLKALLFDSTHEKFRGVVANVAILDGVLQKGETITSEFLKSRQDKGSTAYEVKEVGILRPTREKTDVLYAGQVGYIICGMKTTSEAQIGDTLFHLNKPVSPLPGFAKSKPFVFGDMFSQDQSKYEGLKSALDRLVLNDRSVTVEPISSGVLGAGFRVGFLGLLHMDVFRQRLEQEYDAPVIMTNPNVPFKAVLKPNRKKGIKEAREITITSPRQFPQLQEVEFYKQPMVLGTIISPIKFYKEITELCEQKDGVEISKAKISDTRMMLQYRLPLHEIVVNFYDQLKAVSSGFASFDYDEDGYEKADLVKVEFLLNGNISHELSLICTMEKAYRIASKRCQRLKELIPPLTFAIPIQGAINSKIIARETVKAVKKDVLAKCYGGDYTRKLKLLRRHADHKRKSKEITSVRLPHNLFLKLIKEN